MAVMPFDASDAFSRSSHTLASSSYHLIPNTNFRIFSMHRLSRCSVSALLRNGGASRYRFAAAPISSSNPLHDSNGERDVSSRWHSVLISGNSNRPTSTQPLNLRNGLYLGNRFESTAAASESDAPAETHEYQAEVSRLMDLIVNSLYSNNEVFLRELISSASDALDKLRFLSVTDPDLLQGAVDLDIRIRTDKDNGIVTITDSGIGMTHGELVDCLGTIAQSGTAKFLKALKDSKDAGVDSNLIGQFGVGFYSAFLVADKVVVSTKSPKSDKQYVWEGEANSSTYPIREETDPEKILPRGTRLTLYLKRDEKGYAHPERIQKLVKNYLQFVSFPIYTWQEKGYTKEVEVDEDHPAEAKKDETEANTEKKKKTKTVVEKYWDWELTNETQPIWLRNPKEVSTEEYNEFYKKAFNEYLEPLASSHFTTENWERDVSSRWYSVLISGHSNRSATTKPLNLRNGLYLGNRFESTAAASELDAPAETHEYQAEVSRLMDRIVNSLYSHKEDSDIGEKNEEKEKEMKQEFGPTFYCTQKMASVSSTTNLLLLRRLSRPAFSPPSSVRFLTSSPSRPLYLREAPERSSHVHSPLSYYYPSRNFCSSSSPPLNLGEELSQGPAPMSHRFKTCRLLTSNVWNRELTVIQRRILRKLRSKNRAFKRRIYSKRNQNSFIQLQSTRKLSLCYGAAIRKGNLRARSRASYLLDLERRLDVMQVRMNFSKTVHQARQLISHGKVHVNGKTVRIPHLKLSQGDIISLQDGAGSERTRKLLYIESLVEKVIGKSQKLPLRIWRRTKTEWFRLLKTKRGCRRLLKSWFLQQLHSSMQEDDVERTKKFDSFAEHNKIKRNLYHLKSMFLSRVGKRNPALRSSLTNGSSLYSRSTNVSASPHQSTRRRKRMELPTHYLEVNHKISKGVVFY